MFPSPHSGILFLLTAPLAHTATVSSCFRPLIRGFFFYLFYSPIAFFMRAVSVPSFGDSFFISDFGSCGTGESALWFPSPHSGILFLSVSEYRTSLNPSSCFRPLIRGFFFYKARVNYERDIYITRFRPLIRGFFFYSQS